MIVPEATRRRLPKIKAGLLQGKTSEQIAKECGVTAVTIERDKQSWRQSGDFEDWIKEEWLDLHILVRKQDPVIAYKEITRLLGKTLTQKIESQVKATVTTTTPIPWENIPEVKKAVEKLRERMLKEKSADDAKTKP